MFSLFRKIAEHSLTQPTEIFSQYMTMAQSMSKVFSEPSMPAVPAKQGPKAGTASVTGQPMSVPGPNHYVGLHPTDVLTGIGEMSQKIAMQPDLLLKQNASLTAEFSAIFAGTSLLAPDPNDRRFSDADWHTNPFFRSQLQHYLASSNALHQLIDHAGLDNNTYERMRYLASLFNDAIAPSNHFLANPAALKRAAETGGESVFEGMRNMMEDLANQQSTPSQVDKRKFSVGGNLAATPGVVVFEHPMFELIQYRPVTAEVYEQAQLIVPPNINKFYLVDLAPGRSVIEYLVSQRFQTFAISWRNPSPEHAHWGLDEYMEALLEAIAATTEISQRSSVNLHMICGASRIVAALMGHLANRKQALVNAFSIVCGVLLHNEETPLGPFSSREAIEAAKKKSAAAGVLDGEDMGFAFTWSRPNDLVWNYWVNNYLMGKSPPAFDILYWNDDRTRLPAKLHAEMLDIFADRLFNQPGGIKAFGQAIDLAKVRNDLYVVAGATDHLALWRNVYHSARMFGGQFNFVLNSSGHIQSVINPPGNPKAKYHSSPETPEDPDEWLAGAEARSGSWWEDWAVWLARRSGNLRQAPEQLGSLRYPPGQAAPGKYVLEP
ncbi:MAG TPA: alpha/beta fold hydrolase [Rhodocyclaceae bacterium]|nr:alpha/beta fold hydrolase [Rhodocyclaceae bacterium]